MVTTPIQQRARGPGSAPEVGADPITFERDRAAGDRFREGFLVLAADVATTGAGIATTPVVFTIPVVAFGLYIIEFWLIITTLDTVTGYRLLLNGPASPTSLGYVFRGQSSNTTASESVGQFNAYQTGYDSGFDNAAAGKMPAYGWVLLDNGVNSGNVTLVIRSEVSGSTVTCIAKSICKVTRVR